MDCPYLNANEPQCNQQFNLCRLTQALALCTDDYERCPVYQSLTGYTQEPITPKRLREPCVA